MEKILKLCCGELYLCSILMQKNSYLLTLLLIVSFFPVFGQAYSYQLIPYRKGKLWGYCDSTKKILIKPNWEGSRWFFVFKSSDGLPEKQIGVVKKNGKYGLIDRSGKLLAPCLYEYAESYKRSVNLVRDRKSYLYHIESGKIEFIANLPENWNKIEKVSGVLDEYKITEISKGKFRIIQEKPVFTNGNYIYVKSDSIDYEADALSHFADHNGSDTAFYIVKNGKKGLVTLGGRQLLPPVFDSLVRKPTDYKLGNEAVFCLKDQKWEIAFPFASKDALINHPKPIDGEVHFGSGYSTVLIKNNRGWGLISSNGNILIPPAFDSVVDLRYQEVFGLKMNGTWTIKRIDNRTINNNRYTDVKVAKNGYILAQRQDGNWVLMQEIDKEIFPHTKPHESYHPFYQNFLSVYKDKDGNNLLGFAHSNGTCYWD
jgi:hypothetical protein